MIRKIARRAGAIALCCVAGLSVVSQKTNASKPYADEQHRQIKSLSADDIAAIRAGRGWGFAKPAELNGLPGPLHVLELAERLKLTEAQRAEVTKIFQRMRRDAIAAGEDFLKAERALDAVFAAGAVTAPSIEQLAKAAGIARARVRAVHLRAHLATTPILSVHQRHMYRELRGYARGHDHSDHRHHKH